MKLSQDILSPLLPSLKLAAEKLKGSTRRMFLGQVALDVGRGGKVLVSSVFGISRVTLRKGINEVESGVAQIDQFKERGRKPLSTTNPQLLEDIRIIVDNASQTDPQFKSMRLYTRLSVKEVRKQLIINGYIDKDLPSNQSIWNIMIDLGYKRKKVAKTKPKKK
jgi:hypothetical protein